jgi:ABC-type sugar transport system ATPase subunit
MSALSIRNVVKRYGAAEVIRSLSFDVSPGEFVVFVGPSGCGKSTLLRMIAGLEDFQDGEIAIDGKVVNGLAPWQRDIAMVFQDYALYPHMSVAANIGFSLKMAGVDKKTVAAKVDRVAEVLQIGHLLDRKPKALSGGQRQRVAMGRAMVRDPKIFLFDEPLSNLDAKLRVDMRAEIKQLHQRLGATMIYVTHDQVEAMTLADRIVVLKEGRIEQIGTPTELYRAPASRFVASFIGSPAMNFVPVEVAGGAVTLPGGERIPTRSAHAGRASFGIRPEHLSLGGEGPAIRGVISLVEPLGADTLVTVMTGDERVLARLSGDASPVLGETIALTFDPGRGALFSVEGRRV